jgi:hypothetical protein
MPANKETLRHCALTWFRLLLTRSDSDGKKDDGDSIFDPRDPDVQRTSEYFQSAVNADERNSMTLCLHALFLEKKGDYLIAEGWATDFLFIFISQIFLRFFSSLS